MPKRTLAIAAFLVACLSLPALGVAQSGGDRQRVSRAIECHTPNVTDGDSLRCNDQRIRLLGIDAPEMPGSCRPGRRCVQGDPYAARDYLISLTRTTVRCTPEGRDRYGRTLARCTANGIDLSCAMIRSGHAVRRYADIRCR
nr:thermonuclease family protein [Sphingopyxis sp. EG6]